MRGSRTLAGTMPPTNPTPGAPASPGAPAVSFPDELDDVQAGDAGLPPWPGPLMLPSPHALTAQRRGALAADDNADWPQPHALWDALHAFAQVPSPPLGDGDRSEPMLASDALVLSVGAVAPPEDRLAARGLSLDAWCRTVTSAALAALVRGPPCTPGWSNPFQSFALRHHRQPRRLQVLVARRSELAQAALAYAWVRAGHVEVFCYEEVVRIPISLEPALPAPYSVELVVIGLPCTLACRGVTAAILQAAGYRVVSGMPQAGEVQVVSERLAPHPLGVDSGLVLGELAVVDQPLHKGMVAGAPQQFGAAEVVDA